MKDDWNNPLLAPYFPHTLRLLCRVRLCRWHYIIEPTDVFSQFAGTPQKIKRVCARCGRAQEWDKQQLKWVSADRAPYTRALSGA